MCVVLDVKPLTVRVNGSKNSSRSTSSWYNLKLVTNASPFPFGITVRTIDDVVALSKSKVGALDWTVEFTLTIFRLPSAYTVVEAVSRKEVIFDVSRYIYFKVSLKDYWMSIIELLSF